MLWSFLSAAAQQARPCWPATADATHRIEHQSPHGERTACRYFLQAFLGHPSTAGGNTLSVQTATVPMVPSPSVGEARTASSLTANFDPDAATLGMQPPSTSALRRGAAIFFKESAVMLEKIFEFLYLGEIAKLEEMNGVVDERDHSIWMFLLTWCAPAPLFLAVPRVRLLHSIWPFLLAVCTPARLHRQLRCRSFKHRVHDLCQYILGHLLRVQLAPEFAARLLDLHIESSFSMSESVRVSGSLEGSQATYPVLLERLRRHAIACFNRADFAPEVRPCTALKKKCHRYNMSESRITEPVRAQAATPTLTLSPR